MRGEGHQALLRSVLPSLAGFEPGEQRQQCGRGHAFDSPGLGDGRRAVAGEFLADFGRKAWQTGVIEVVGDAYSLVALQLGDVLVLAPQIGSVAGVDFELGGNLRINPADFVPDGLEAVERDFREAPADRTRYGGGRRD